MITELEKRLLNDFELTYIDSIIQEFKGMPNLIELWKLMDEVWDSTMNVQESTEHNLSKFYNHPVWLLNGLFIDQDKDSLDFRNAFANKISSFNPARVADYGGGFGTLSRHLAMKSINTNIDIIEPYPHTIAIVRCRQFSNVQFKSSFDGIYDIIVATDVFEHLSDPISSLNETTKYLKHNGRYFLANCFQPLIKCHLKEHLHFRYSWKSVMKSMGYKYCGSVQYGEIYQKVNKENIKVAYKIQWLSKLIYPILSFLPKGRTKTANFIIGLYLLFVIK